MEHASILKTVIIPFINFAVFLVILVQVGKKKLQEYAAQEKRDLEAKFKQAEDERRKVEAEHARVSREKAGLKQAAAHLHDSIVKSGTHEAATIAEETKRLAKTLEEEAHKSVHAEVAEMRRAVLQTIVTDGLAKAKQKLKTQLDDKKQHEIVHAAVSGAQ